MNNQQLLDAVNAAGITPDELTVTLKGGALSVRNTTLGLKIEALRKQGAEAQSLINGQISALESEMNSLRAAQVDALGEQ